MAAEIIGRCHCPLCRSDKGRLTLAKSGLPVFTCNGCNIQLFARSDRSDELLRALLVKEPATAPAQPEPTPAPAAKPAQEEPPPKPAPAAPAAPARSPFGLLNW